MKSKRCAALLLAPVLCLTALCACGASPAASETSAETAAPTAPETPAAASAQTEITVTDGVGREVTIVPGSYQRVVCIGAGALRMYCYVGDVSLLCGVEDIDNLSLSDRPKMFDSVARPYMLRYGDVFEALPSCGVGGPNAQTAEAEKILACGPDIVLSEYEDADKADALQEQLGVPVLTLRAGQDGVFSEALLDSLTLMGKAFDREERADELVAYIETETAELSRRTEGAEDGRKAYICGLGNWGTTNHLMTSQNYKPFRVANIPNVVSDLAKDGMQAIEAEKFTALGGDMDVMFIDAAAIKNIGPLFREDAAMFDSCKAWQDGEVYLEMAYNAYYTNYEIALMNTWYMAKVMYPERFEDIDIQQKLDEITEAFLGEGLAKAIFDCPSSYGGYQKVSADFFSWWG